MPEISYEDAANLFNTYKEMLKSPDMLMELANAKHSEVDDIYFFAKAKAEKYQKKMEELKPDVEAPKLSPD